MQQTPIHPLNENYKAMITTLPIKDQPIQYEVVIYQWSEEEFDDEGKNLWERIAGPFVTEDEAQAKTLAREQLALFTGEEIDEDVSPSLIREIEKHVPMDQFLVLKAKPFEVLYFNEDGIDQTITGETIIATCDVYLVKADEEWYTGFLDGDRTIHCFRKTTDLEKALTDINQAAE